MTTECSCIFLCTQSQLTPLAEATCQAACHSTCLTNVASATCPDCCPAAPPTLCGTSTTSIAACTTSSTTATNCYAGCTGTDLAIANCLLTCRSGCTLCCDCCPEFPQTVCGTSLLSAKTCSDAGAYETYCYNIICAAETDSVKRAVCQEKCYSACLGSTCAGCCPLAPPSFCTTPTLTGQSSARSSLNVMTIWGGGFHLWRYLLKAKRKS